MLRIHKKMAVDVLSTVIFDPGSRGYHCHLCSVAIKGRADISFHMNGKNQSARAALAHQSALKIQRNNISIYAHNITYFYISIFIHAALIFSSSSDRFLNPSVVAPSSFVTHFPDEFDVQWQDRFPIIYVSSLINDAHPCIFPPGYPPVPPFACHFCSIESFSTLDALNNHLGSPQHIAAFKIADRFHEFGATQAFSLHFTSLEIIRHLATSDDFALDNRMRYLHDFQPRNPERLSICQPSSSAVESPPKQRPLDNSGPIWSTTSASDIAIAAQPMDPTFALTDSFNENLNVTAMPSTADRITANAPIAQAFIRTRVPPPRNRIANPDDGSELKYYDYEL